MGTPNIFAYTKQATVMTSLCVHMHVCEYVWVCMRMCVYAHICVCMHVRVCVHVCACVCAYTCAHMLVYTNSHCGGTGGCVDNEGVQFCRGQLLI